MTDLVLRTVSQGLQAFLPVAFALVWFQRSGTSTTMSGLRWGIVAAVPLSIAATYVLHHSTRQALLEAALAMAALPLALWFAKTTWQGLPAQPPATSRQSVAWLAAALASALIIARQAMEIGVALWATVQVRAAEPMLAVVIGTIVSLAAGALWLRVGRRLSSPALVAATAVFATMFAAQVAMYALHEATEARLLPWSEPLHAATEPYGPDGLFGRYFSVLLFLAPLGAATIAAGVGLRRIILRPITVSGAIVLVAGIALIAATNTERAETAAPAAPELALAVDTTTTPASPRVVFRHTGMDKDYSRLSSSSLDATGPGTRRAAALTCERVSFAAGRGICLEADRGIFTTYKAVIYGAAFNPIHTVKLAGSPSRTRVSPDGRVGAITVFVTGQVHKYEGSDFSTRTTIIDMATGDELGELEQFTTWRDGKRFKAADFNFWGVTFARDSNTFYATLATAGTTYLVRGDLGLRKLTVLRENVECPSLSPDNQMIAFKKKVAKADAPWRVYILDLATMTERPVPGEDRSIDDQIEWLDGSHLLYGVPRTGPSGRQDVWVAALDGSAAPKIFLPDADSPIVVR